MFYSEYLKKNFTSISLWDKKTMIPLLWGNSSWGNSSSLGQKIPYNENQWKLRFPECSLVCSMVLLCLMAVLSQTPWVYVTYSVPIQYFKWLNFKIYLTPRSPDKWLWSCIFTARCSRIANKKITKFRI